MFYTFEHARLPARARGRWWEHCNQLMFRTFEHSGSPVSAGGRWGSVGINGWFTCSSILVSLVGLKLDRGCALESMNGKHTLEYPTLPIMAGDRWREHCNQRTYHTFEHSCLRIRDGG